MIRPDDILTLSNTHRLVNFTHLCVNGKKKTFFLQVAVPHFCQMITSSIENIPFLPMPGFNPVISMTGNQGPVGSGTKGRASDKVLFFPAALHLSQVNKGSGNRS